MINEPTNHIPEAEGLAAETADRLSRTAYNAKEAATQAAHRAQLELQRLRIELARVANKTELLARENPWATAGTMLGVGIVLGAVGYRLFAPKPTLAQVLGMDRLADSGRYQLKKQMRAFRKLF